VPANVNFEARDIFLSLDSGKERTWRPETEVLIPEVNIKLCLVLKLRSKIPNDWRRAANSGRIHSQVGDSSDFTFAGRVLDTGCGSFLIF
jgi:hypothetical protein